MGELAVVSVVIACETTIQVSPEISAETIAECNGVLELCNGLNVKVTRAVRAMSVGQAETEKAASRLSS